LKKKSRLGLIIFGVIILIIAGLSITKCIEKDKAVNYSEFYNLVELVSNDDTGLATKDELDGAKNISSIKSAIKGVVGENKELVNVSITKASYDGYILNFNVRVQFDDGYHSNVSFSTVTSRSDIAYIQEKLNFAGASFSHADPNEGAIWSSLLPIIGCLVIAVVFFILMMQTQGKRDISEYAVKSTVSEDVIIDKYIAKKNSFAVIVCK